MTFPVHRAPARRLFALVALLASFAPGCSKHPPAPEIPGPTRFMVFASDRGRTAGSYRNFYSLLDGSGASQFTVRNTAGLVDKHPSLSQDGRLLCFQSGPATAGSQDVLIFNRATNAVIDDANINTDFNEIEPQISLDGTKVVFVRDSLGIKHIRLYDLTTRTFIPLPNLEAPGFSDWEPSIDATGQTIAFTTNRNGSSDVELYRRALSALADSSALQSTVGDIEPAVSGDGRYVAFASNRPGGAGDFDLYLFDAFTGLLVSLPSTTNTTAEERDPTLSYDGSNLVFVSNRLNGQGGYDLWNMNRIAGILSQPVGESSPQADIEPYVVWP